MNKTTQVRKLTEREKFAARHVQFLAGLPTRTPEQELIVALSRLMLRSPRQESEFKTLINVAYAEDRAKKARISAKGITATEERKTQVEQRRKRARELIQDGLLLRELLPGMSQEEITGGLLMLGSSMENWRKTGDSRLSRCTENGRIFLAKRTKVEPVQGTEKPGKHHHDMTNDHVHDKKSTGTP